LLLVGVLVVRRVPGAILIAIVGVSVVAWVLELAEAPRQWLAAPHLPRETFLALDFGALFSGSVLAAVLAFFFVDLLDTAGTLIGVGQLGGFVDQNGDLERADRAFVADALGTTIGAALGTSTVTSYIESATGIEEGGRTGLTAVTVSLLFLAALVLTPVFIAVPAAATAPALIVVGALMMRGAAEIDWRRLDEALPAFLTITVMPFTYSIANGLVFGIVAWVVIKSLTGRHREVGAVMWALAILLLVFVFVLRPA
jgi:AGZA family xanthine/uracil permease-like MFS transporter